VSVPETVADGVVESEESSARVSSDSARGRRDRLGGFGFRVDMDQTPFFQEARPANRCGAHLERRSSGGPGQISLAPLKVGVENAYKQK
jgi:hypothetical protein